MLKTKNVTDVFRMPVYTDEGDYYGEAEEAILQGNKVIAWKVKATKGSKLGRLLTGAKGATVAHQLVKSIGDVMLISQTALPSGDEDPDELDDF